MAHSSWGPGWPNCQPGKIDSSFIVDGTRFPGGVRHELVDLVAMLVRETKARGYRFGTATDPSYGCWGYSCRAISGSNNPSNHSWGLAVDINAPSNPYTSPLRTDMPPWMPKLWNAYGFRWGGDYTGAKDAMHYEYMGSVTDAANDTARARADGIGGGGSGPTPEPPKLKDEDGMTAQIVMSNGTVNIFAVADDGRVYQQWQAPGTPSGWSGWSAGIPGEWVGGLSVTRGDDDGVSLFGVDKAGQVCQVWTTPDGWMGPVAFTGIKANC